MQSTLPADTVGTITAQPGGYVAVHPNGHSSHGPLPTLPQAVDALDHRTRTGAWPEVAA